MISAKYQSANAYTLSTLNLPSTSNFPFTSHPIIKFEFFHLLYESIYNSGFNHLLIFISMYYDSIYVLTGISLPTCYKCLLRFRKQFQYFINSIQYFINSSIIYLHASLELNLLYQVPRKWNSVQFSSVAQSCPTQQPHEPQHTSPPCPSPIPRVYPNSCPLSW